MTNDELEGFELFGGSEDSVTPEECGIQSYHFNGGFATDSLSWTRYAVYMNFEFKIPPSYYHDFVQIEVEIPVQRYLTALHRRIHHLTDMISIYLDLPAHHTSLFHPRTRSKTSCGVSHIMCIRLTPLLRDLYSKSGLSEDFFGGVEPLVKMCFRNLFESCAVCDQPLVGIFSIRLTYCDNDACSFSFTELGVGFSVLAFIQKSPQVTELLLTFALNAVTDRDKERLFENCPTDFANEPIAYEDIAHEIKSINPITHYQSLTHENQLRKVLGEKRLRLLRWIIATNRSLIAHIPETSRYYHRSLGGTQFLLSAVDPKREVEFQRLAQNGYVWTFHGSPAGCWWRIIGRNQSLLNLSGTSLQRHGRILGYGVYASPFPSVARIYGKKFTSRNDLLPSGSAIVACQIASNNGFDYTRRGNSRHYVVRDSKYIFPRYFIINANNEPTLSGIIPDFSSEEALAELF
ncbi:hypothetical protein P9112_014297 [Eukaryota sp. TZLM1-RC]